MLKIWDAHFKECPLRQGQVEGFGTDAHVEGLPDQNRLPNFFEGVDPDTYMNVEEFQPGQNPFPESPNPYGLTANIEIRTQESAFTNDELVPKTSSHTLPPSYGPLPCSAFGGRARDETIYITETELSEGEEGEGEHEEGDGERRHGTPEVISPPPYPESPESSKSPEPSESPGASEETSQLIPNVPSNQPLFPIEEEEEESMESTQSDPLEEVPTQSGHLVEESTQTEDTDNPYDFFVRMVEEAGNDPAVLPPPVTDSSNNRAQYSTLAILKLFIGPGVILFILGLWAVSLGALGWRVSTPPSSVNDTTPGVPIYRSGWAGRSGERMVSEEEGTELEDVDLGSLANSPEAAPEDDGLLPHPDEFELSDPDEFGLPRTNLQEPWERLREGTASLGTSSRISNSGRWGRVQAWGSSFWESAQYWGPIVWDRVRLWGSIVWDRVVLFDSGLRNWELYWCSRLLPVRLWQVVVVVGIVFLFIRVYGHLIITGGREWV